MDLTSLKTIKDLLVRHRAAPSKFMGQNFLTSKTVLQKIIEAADIKPGDTVLEVGPGLGTLTQELAARAGRVIAIEKDSAMLNILEETLGDYSNIEVIQADILKLSIINYQLSNYKVVANLPYYITSPIIRMFLEAKNPPQRLVLMVQKEVAQRICAKPPHMSILAVSVQFYADAKIVASVPKENFWPAPKVGSAIIMITPQNSSESEFNVTSQGKEANRDVFFKIVKAGFSHPRKQLGGNLAANLKMDKEAVALWLTKNNINPKQRAETLSLDDWRRLTESFLLISTIR